MACSYRKTLALIAQELFLQPYRFSYEQVVRLLHWQGITVHTRPHLSLSFPATDVVSLAQVTSQTAVVTMNFLGLYGPDSPLPTFYTEELLEEAEESAAAREFYDLLNQPFYEHYYNAWLKCRFMLRWVEAQDSELRTQIASLLGVAYPAAGCAEQLLPYIGLLTHLPRTALGLEILLTHAIGCRVALEPFVAQWVSIPVAQRSQLGRKNHQLGITTHLGERCLDSNGYCYLHLWVEHTACFMALLPQQPLYLQLARLCTHYLLDPIEITLCIWPHSTIVPPPRLQADVQLGINSWLQDPVHHTPFPFAAQFALGVPTL